MGMGQSGGVRRALRALWAELRGCEGGVGVGVVLTLSPCSDFVRHELQRGFQGAVYSDVAEFGRFATALAGELVRGGGGSH